MEGVSLDLSQLYVDKRFRLVFMYMGFYVNETLLVKMPLYISLSVC